MLTPWACLPARCPLELTDVAHDRLRLALQASAPGPSGAIADNSLGRPARCPSGLTGVANGRLRLALQAPLLISRRWRIPHAPGKGHAHGCMLGLTVAAPQPALPSDWRTSPTHDTCAPARWKAPFLIPSRARPMALRSAGPTARPGRPAWRGAGGACGGAVMWAHALSTGTGCLGLGSGPSKPLRRAGPRGAGRGSLDRPPGP